MNSNILSGSVILIGSLIYTILAYLIPSAATSDQIGARIYPILIGIVMIIVSVALLIQGLKEHRLQTIHKAEDNQEPTVAVKKIDEKQKKMIVLIIIFLAYIFLFDILGYLFSTILFILSITMFLERKKWRRNLIYSIVFPVIVYYLFNEILSVYLPKGIF